MIIEAGRILSGRYRLVRPLGEGAQGAVWVADHLALTTQVAVKLIDAEVAKQSDALERFKREATAAAQLRSAHIIQILDHGVDGAQPFIVMELLEGEDLFDRIDKRKRLSLKETSKIVTQVARALTRAHAAGIVHRDLKPENVFLVPNDDDEVAKVLDFGVAKVVDPAKRTMQRTGIGTLIGTPHYMSPEQVKGVQEVDYRTDIWALGVIAYQCVTGRLPFESEGVGDLLIKITIGDLPVPSKIVPTLPATFDAWFAKICDRDPERRFDTARDAAEALAKAVGLGERAAGIPRPNAEAGAPKAPPVPPAPKRIAPVFDEAELKAAARPGKMAESLAPPPRAMLESTDVEFEIGESVRPPAAPPSSAPPPRIALRSAPNTSRVRSQPPSSTVSGVASSGLSSLPPPELDGSRRRRAVWVVGLLFVAIAGGVAWFTIRPNLSSFRQGTAAAPTETRPTVLEVPTAVQIGEPGPVPVGSAVDPGAHRSTSPAALPLKPPSPAGAVKHGGKAKSPGTGDEPTIVMPEPDEKAAEPKAPRGGPPPAPDDPPPAP